MGAEQCYRTVYRKWYARKFEGWKRHCSCELLSCLTLCDPMDCSLPGSSVHGLLQARALEWVAISFSRDSSQPRDRTQVSHIVGQTPYRLSHQGSLVSTVQFSSVTQLCPTLCNLMDCSTPGLPVHHQLPEFTQTHVH